MWLKTVKNQSTRSRTKTSRDWQTFYRIGSSSKSYRLGNSKKSVIELLAFKQNLVFRTLNVNNMKTVFHPSSQRGKANHGWLNSRHSFSFANYHDSSKMNFGLLRVLNDDVVSGGQGFGKHPHENMEIISIPLSGDLKHEDSMGNKTVIREGEIQVMSAGTGIFHSEYNANKEQAVEFLQIWIFPRSQDIPHVTIKPSLMTFIWLIRYTKF